MSRNAHQLTVFTVSCLFAFLSLVSTAFSQQKVYTVAGGYVGDGGPATAASFPDPQYAAVDTNGNLYISDYSGCRIRKVDTAGNISTIAGTGICGYTGDGGLATHAQIYWPEGLAVDGRGNVYFADFVNVRIRMITSSGRISTIAGNGSFGFCGDGGPAIQACLGFPMAIALANGGSEKTLYIADTYNQRIREVNLKTGIINTAAGNGNPGYSGDGGPAIEASLNMPQGIAAHPQSDALWISDTWNSSIRRVNTKTGVITTFFGDGNCGLTSCFPEGISIDGSGNLYVTYAGTAVFELEVPSGNVIVKAGAEPGLQGFGGDGGPATSAFLNFAWDPVADASGNILIVDSLNNRVRKVDTSGTISTIAGGYVGDGGRALASSLNWAQGLAFDKKVNLYIADTWNHRVRKVGPNGAVSTIAGTGLTGYSGDGGPASQAELNEPLGVAADAKGNVFIADSGNFALRKVDSHGVITTFASGVFLSSLAIDGSGNIYASDTSCVVRRFTPKGQVTIVAGVLFNCGFNADGIPATEAWLSLPEGIALDTAGNLYISDNGNQRVRMVDSQGIIHTVAGNGTCSFSGDGGPAADATLCGPQGVGRDANGNLYIADAYNGRIRVVNSAQIIDTYAGWGGGGYNGNGTPALQTDMEPFPLACSPSGIVYYGDILTYRVRNIR